MTNWDEFEQLCSETLGTYDRSAHQHERAADASVSTSGPVVRTGRLPSLPFSSPSSHEELDQVLARTAEFMATADALVKEAQVGAASLTGYSRTELGPVNPF